jgi:putative ABC transport system permease protein
MIVRPVPNKSEDAQESLMETLLEDVRHSLRMVRRNPVFAAIVLLTLALSIGVNTTVFGVIDAVLLRPLPFRDPGRLVKIMFSKPGVGLHDITFSYPEFDDLRKKSSVFEEISIVWPASGNLTGGQQPVRLELLACNPNYFSMLGTQPQVGRLFGPEDSALGFAQAAVISDSLWRRSFGADVHAIGKILQIDSDPYTIVGVLPPEFRHPGRTVSGEVDVWLTAGFSGDPFKVARSNREFPGAIGRLKPGIGMMEAQNQLDILAADERQQYPNDYPANGKWSIEIEPLRQALVGEVRPILIMLMGAAVLIGLLACANVSSLFLARAYRRPADMAIAADRARMRRRTLTESLVLSLLAAVLGVLIAAEAWRVILRFVPVRIPRLAEVGVHWTVVFFALFAALVVGMLSGLGSASRSPGRGAASTVLIATDGFSPRAVRLRALLVGLELAIAAVLTVQAGKQFHALWGLLHEDPGFHSSHLIAARIWLPIPNNPKTDKYEGLGPQSRVLRAILAQVRAIPGVDAVAMTSALPLLGGRQVRMQLAVEGRPAAESSPDLRAEVIRASPDFFQVMETPLVLGRSLSETDEKDQPEVAVIDESTAHRFWPNQNPIGKHVRNVADSTTHPVVITVVGVAKDIKHDGLDKSEMSHLYTSFYQRSGRALALVVRTETPLSTLAPQLQKAVQTVDPDLPLFGVSTMDNVLLQSLAPRRFSVVLFGTFAALAVFLALTGVYSLLAFVTGQRPHEIGLPVAAGMPNMK